MEISLNKEKVTLKQTKKIVKKNESELGIPILASKPLEGL